MERRLRGDSADGTGHGDGITVPVLATTIRGALDDLSIDRVDFISFDTCLMAGPEVIHPLRGLAEIYFASAELDFGVGWDYTATLTWLGANPEASLMDLATNEIAHWDAHHTTPAMDHQTDIALRTHTAINLRDFDAFTTAMDTFTTSWIDSTSFDDEDAAFGLVEARPAYNNTSVDEMVQFPKLRDLGEFLDGMAMSTSDATVAANARAARTALGAMIMASSLGDMRSRQVGFHIQLPSPNQVADEMASYRTLAASWIGATGWDEALERLAGAADSTAPMPTITAEGTTTNPSPASRARSRVATPPDSDLSEAIVFLTGIDAVDSNIISVYGLLAAGDVDPSTEYVIEWDGGQFTIGDENVALMPFITTDASVETGTSFLAVPILLIDGTERIEAQLLVDANDGSIFDVVVMFDESSSVFELVELAGVDFVPVIPGYNIATDTEIRTEGAVITIPSDGMLQLDYLDALAGDYFVATEITDVHGNAEIDGFAATVGGDAQGRPADEDAERHHQGRGEAIDKGEREHAARREHPHRRREAEPPEAIRPVAGEGRPDRLHREAQAEEGAVQGGGAEHHPRERDFAAEALDEQQAEGREDEGAARHAGHEGGAVDAPAFEGPGDVGGLGVGLGARAIFVALPFAQHQEARRQRQGREGEQRGVEPDRVREQAARGHGREGPEVGDAVVEAEGVAAPHAAGGQGSEEPAEAQEGPQGAPHEAKGHPGGETRGRGIGRGDEGRPEHRGDEGPVDPVAARDHAGDGVRDEADETVGREQHTDHPELETEVRMDDGQDGVEQCVAGQRGGDGEGDGHDPARRREPPKEGWPDHSLLGGFLAERARLADQDACAVLPSRTTRRTRPG